MIHFTQHAQEQFELLERHGILITKEQVKKVVSAPDEIDYRLRRPFIIASSAFDERRNLRIVEKQIDSVVHIITFYLIKYEKKQD